MNTLPNGRCLQTTLSGIWGGHRRLTIRNSRPAIPRRSHWFWLLARPGSRSGNQHGGQVDRSRAILPSTCRRAFCPAPHRRHNSSLSKRLGAALRHPQHSSHLLVSHSPLLAVGGCLARQAVCSPRHRLQSLRSDLALAPETSPVRAIGNPLKGSSYTLQSAEIRFNPADRQFALRGTLNAIERVRGVFN